jgi:hypothetical protein
MPHDVDRLFIDVHDWLNLANDWIYWLGRMEEFLLYIKCTRNK